MKTLVHEDHNLLSEPCIPFSRLAPPIDAMQLHDELLESMHHFGGVGLSSNQIGYKYKVFSMIHDDKDMVLYNPEIIEESEDKFDIIYKQIKKISKVYLPSIHGSLISFSS